MWSLHSRFLVRLTFLTINISRCIQKQIELDWCIRKTRMYDETHQIQVALIQNVVSMLTVPSLLCSISVSISTDVSRNQFNWNGTKVNQRFLMKLTKFRLLQYAISILTVLCSLYCIWVSISADVSRNQYTGKPRMYDETHQIQIALITKCGLYTHGPLFTLLYLSINISRCIQN